MEKCRNCGQKTLVTLDWACPWCGFPLKKGKRMEITYAQAVKLRRMPEEQIWGTAEECAEEYEAGMMFAGKSVHASEALPDFLTEPVFAPQHEEEPPVMNTKSETTNSWEERAQLIEPEEYAEEEKSEVFEGTRESALERIMAEEEPEKDNALENEEPFQDQAIHLGECSDQAVESELESCPEPVAAIDITLEELMAAYQQDEASADVHYNEQTLALAGVVALVNLRENRDIQYVTLTGADQNIFRSIKCMFNRDKAFQLQELERGQSVVITGRFRGSLTSMSLVDCAIV